MSSRSNSNSNSKDYPPVLVNVDLDSESNQLLTEGAQRSKRRKRCEASVRLKDHLLRFKDIATAGCASEWHEDEKPNG